MEKGGIEFSLRLLYPWLEELIYSPRIAFSGLTFYFAVIYDIIVKFCIYFRIAEVLRRCFKCKGKFNRMVYPDS